MRTDTLNRLQHGIAAAGIQMVRRLLHAFSLEGGAWKMLFHKRCPESTVSTVDGTSCIAVQVATVAGKGNQINHGQVDSNARRNAP